MGVGWRKRKGQVMRMSSPDILGLGGWWLVVGGDVREGVYCILRRFGWDGERDVGWKEWVMQYC